MLKEIYTRQSQSFHKKKITLNINNIDLPKIIKNNNKNISPKISKTNPNLKRRIEDYKIKNNFKLPKLDSSSVRYYQILTTENVKGLAKKYLQSNKNIFSYLKDKGEMIQKKIEEKMEMKEPNNIYGNKIKKMIRLHSSTYHPEKEIQQTSLDEFDTMLNKLKYGKYYLEDEDREIKYRQRLAFKYRFLQSKKNLMKINFDKMNSKMNQLLSISKSIPNYLLNQNKKNKLKEEKKEEGNKQTDSINRSINFSSIHNKSNRKSKLDYFIKFKITNKNKEHLMHNNKNNIIAFDKNGKKYISHLSLLL